MHFSLRRAVGVSLSVACCFVIPAQAQTTTGKAGAAQSTNMPADARVLQAAHGLLAREQYALAADEYRKYLESASGESVAVARYGLAVCLSRQDKLDDARAELEKIELRESFPYRAEVRAMLGQSHLAAGRLDSAIECFDALLRESPDHDLADDVAALAIEAAYRANQPEDVLRRSADWLRRWRSGAARERVELLAGLAELSRSAFAKAAERLGAWLDEFPKSSDADRALLALAQALHALGKSDLAQEKYRALIERGESASLSDALLGLATLQRESGKRADALALLEQALARKPGEALHAALQMQRARVLLDDGKPDDALTVFDEIRQRGGQTPRAAEAAYWAAKCRLRQGAAQDAAGRLATLLANEAARPWRTEIQYDLALAQYRAGQLAEARAALEAFRSANPKHELAPDALHLLAAIAQQEKRYDDCAALCAEFAKAHRGSDLKSAIEFLAAESEYLAGRLPQAIKRFEQFVSDYPKDAQARRAVFRIAMALFRLDRFDDAAPRLAEFVREKPGDDMTRAALLALGDIEFNRGEWRAAEEHLRRILESGGVDGAPDDVNLKLGLTLARQQRDEEALPCFERVLSIKPTSPHHLQALFEKGQSLLVLKRTDDARQVFEKVLSEGADSRFAPFANQHLAAIALQTRDFSKAAERYKLAADSAPEAGGGDALLRQGQALLAGGDFAGAEAALRQFLSRNSKHEEAPVALAQLSIAQARQDRADDALRAIALLEKRGVSKIDAALLRSVRHEQAWCLRRSDKKNQAEAVYRALLAEPGGENDWHALLAVAEFDSDAERFSQAAEALRRMRAAILSPGAGPAAPPEVIEPALYRLGICEFKLKRYREAAEALDDLLARAPTGPLAASANYFCGESLYQSAAHEKAVERLARVIELAPNDALAGPALLRLGEALAAGQKWARSEKAFTDYLDRFSGSEFAYQARFGVGWARENLGRHDEAIEAYRAVTEKHQGETAARAQFQIGECLFAQKKHEAAVRELMKVDILYAFPQWSAAAIYEAGRCFEQLGQRGDARKQFGEVIAKHKGTRWAELAQQRLAALADSGVAGKPTP